MGWRACLGAQAPQVMQDQRSCALGEHVNWSSAGVTTQELREAGVAPGHSPEGRSISCPAGTPSWAISMHSMSSTCRRRSSSPASATSPTPGCTAVCTSCRRLDTGEVAGPARAERTGRRRRGGSRHGLWAGTPSLTHLLLPLSPLSLPWLSSLRPLDIEFLQRLCRTVNVVPVIARADSLTIEERENFRRRVIWVPGARLGAVQVGRGQSA